MDSLSLGSLKPDSLKLDSSSLACLKPDSLNLACLSPTEHLDWFDFCLPCKERGWFKERTLT